LIACAVRDRARSDGRESSAARSSDPFVAADDAPHEAIGHRGPRHRSAGSAPDAMAARMPARALQAEQGCPGH